MYSLEEIDDIWSQISSTSHQQDLSMNYSQLEGSDLHSNHAQKKPRKLSDLPDDNENNGNDDLNKIKMMRRDMERQRRKEMSTLFASLRSLLPIEYIKGKRSVCDHVAGAVNHIKHLEKKIKELSDKRDQLKTLSNSIDFRIGNETLNKCSMNSIMVRPCLGGLRIMISSSFDEEEVKLSKVLHVLLEEGFDVASCISTKVNQRLLHTLELEVCNKKSYNLSELQQKLGDAVILSLR